MLTTNLDVRDIRGALLESYLREMFVADKSGGKVVELVGTSFVASDDHIFGKPNYDYIRREIEWYRSQSLDVNDIPGETPKIWQQVSSEKGEINSNYGWCLFSKDNYHQLAKVFGELTDNPDTRRAIAIYTRPSMHSDYNRDGMSDFMCTNTVQYVIRHDKVCAIVNMRSNDVVFGYRNDYAWQLYALHRLTRSLNIMRSSDDKLEVGDIIWQTGSLHMYERDFWRLEIYDKLGESDAPKKRWTDLINERV